MAFIKMIIESEGYNRVVLTVIKDKKETVRTSCSGIYRCASNSSFYPGYYGGFYNYYSYPQAYGSQNNSFGGYLPRSTSTRVSNDYVLETVVQNLRKSDKNQLVAVITSSIDNRKESHKTVEKYVDLTVKTLEKKKNQMYLSNR